MAMTEELKAKMAAGREAARLKKQDELNPSVVNTPRVPSNPSEMNPPSQETLPPEPQKTYTIEDVRQMMAEFVAKVNVAGGAPAEQEEKDPNRHTVRLSRLKAKFVTDFKDMNDDPYTNKIIHSFNKWDERESQWVAWITLVYQDLSEEEVPLKYFVETAVGVECDIVSKEEKDTSYSLGKVERQAIKSYRPEGTGILVDQRVISKSVKYTVRTPKSKAFPQGETLTVPEYVVNIAGAPTTINR